MGLNATARTNESNVSVLDPLANQARDSLRELAEAVAQLQHRVDANFGRAVRILSRVEGHVILCGVGKSGLIGRKIAATLASTGTPAFFVHAAEAYHGDLGMITEKDAVVLISYSGRTEEVLRLVPHIERKGVPLVVMVGDRRSPLARRADALLDVGVEREICPNNLAPTSSTLATLAMGDALAAALTRLRGFREEDFAKLHPGGSLGRRLSRVGDVMSSDPIPVVRVGSPVRECALALARSPLPFALVLDGDRLVGVVGAGELQKGFEDLDQPVEEVMSPEPPVVAIDALVADAEELLEAVEVGALVVVDESGRVCGTFSRRSA